MANTESEISALERAWGVALPDGYREALSAGTPQAIGDCDLLTLDELLADAERRRGMFPRLLPFAWPGDELVYAFHRASGDAPHPLPVVCWDRERDHCWPVAAGYDAFAERMETEAAWEAGEGGGSESDLARRMVELDPAACDAQLLLACTALAAGDLEGARAHAARTAAEAPWFADAHYVLGQIEQALGRTPAAFEARWRVLGGAVALSTITDRYDLGADHPEAEIHEAAVNALEDTWDQVPAAMRGSPLGRVVRRPDTFNARVRLELARELEADGDTDGAERERLNALALATTDREMDVAYDALIAAYDRAGRAWDAERCRLDRELEE